MKLNHYIFQRGKQGGDFAKNYRSKWTLVFTWRDDRGKNKSKSYRFATKQDAQDARPKLEADLERTEGRSVEGDRMTFADFADFAKRTFYRPAEIKDGRKVGGVKSISSTHSLIDSLVEYFGNRKLSTFKRSDMDGFKSWRLKQGDRRGEQGKLTAKDRRPVSIPTVNRALAVYKRMMRYAYAEGMISRDVTLGSKAIDRDAEKARTRTLTRREEVLLLASCGGEGRTFTYKRKGKTVTATIDRYNPYLKALILLGLYAGLRRNEALTLEWSDVNFKKKIINVQSQNTKTQQGRAVPLLDRVSDELRALPSYGEKGRIFPFSSFDRSWNTAVETAELEDLGFHDLRRTFITRMSASGVALGFAGKIAGHSDLRTTQKHYISTDDLAILDDVRRRFEALGDADSDTDSDFVN